MGKLVMIMAGGTGGHVYPALAVAEDLRGRGHEVVWLGTRAGLEARVVPAAGIPVEWLAVTGLRGKGWKARLAAPAMLLRALTEAWRIVRRVRPAVVLGMGGFVSGPGGLVAKLLGIPLVLHEQNRVPGTTNRWLARWANVVLEAFPESFPESTKARCTGNPLRGAIAALSGGEAGAPTDAPPRLLILGGSQGAKALNDVVPKALAALSEPVDVLHQTGATSRDATETLYQSLGKSAKVEAFIDDMASAYRAADLVICRSGAMTVSELAAAGLPAIFIPFPHATDDHQTRNAAFLVEQGAARLIPQAELTAERLAAELHELLTDRSRLQVMGERARAVARPEAGRVVADICLAEARS